MSLGEQVVAAALQHGRALFKVVSANDAGTTGAHQYGFHLPKAAWRVYTPYPPERGRNDDHPVQLTWQDGRVTDSVVKWYGQLTRSEYRLTRFGREFSFRTPDDVGAVLVLVPVSVDRFLAFLLSSEADLEAAQAELGIEVSPGRGWALYLRGHEDLLPPPEAEDECIDRHCLKVAENLEDFPSGDDLTQKTREILQDCVARFGRLSSDEQVIRLADVEYTLFRTVERKVCGPEIVRPFDSVDDFLKTANSIMQRRKSRAGRALENQVGLVLRERGIPYEPRPRVQGAPDIVIPSLEAYKNLKHREDQLFVVPVKTTCKDRWRQVLEEGPRVKKRYLFTTQRGISQPQMSLMHAAGITLVVPLEVQKDYPKERTLEILSFEMFISLVKQRLGV